MNKQEILYEYETILLGKKGSVDSDLLSYSPVQNEALALEVFRYAIEKIMHWSPMDAYYHLNNETIKLLKLASFAKQINFPPEFNPKTDYFYIVSRLYPDKIKINIKERALIMYQNLLEGKIKKFPKRFTEGRDGEMRSLFCLKYAIKNYGTFTDIEDLYRAFSEQDGVNFLKQVKLFQACSTIFEFPIDFLHAAFSEEEQVENEFIYTMYRFRAYENELRRLRINEARRLKRIENAKRKEEEQLAEESPENTDNNPVTENQDKPEELGVLTENEIGTDTKATDN